MPFLPTTFSDLPICLLRFGQYILSVDSTARQLEFQTQHLGQLADPNTRIRIWHGQGPLLDFLESFHDRPQQEVSEPQLWTRRPQTSDKASSDREGSLDRWQGVLVSDRLGLPRIAII